METNGSSQNGTYQLETAMANLIQSQAMLAGQLADNAHRHIEYERETKENIAQMKVQFADIIRILNEHTRQIDYLTNAVRDRIGFKN